VVYAIALRILAIKHLTIDIDIDWHTSSSSTIGWKINNLFCSRDCLCTPQNSIEERRWHVGQRQPLTLVMGLMNKF